MSDDVDRMWRIMRQFQEIARDYGFGKQWQTMTDVQSIGASLTASWAAAQEGHLADFNCPPEACVGFYLAASAAWAASYVVKCTCDETANKYANHAAAQILKACGHFRAGGDREWPREETKQNTNQ